MRNIFKDNTLWRHNVNRSPLKRVHSSNHDDATKVVRPQMFFFRFRLSGGSLWQSLDSDPKSDSDSESELKWKLKPWQERCLCVVDIIAAIKP